MNEVLFSSKKTEYETPDDLFNQLNKQYRFKTDVCATSKNAKCKKFYSIKDDGLSKRWTGVCWMNPPYGRNIGEWIKKAYESNALVVALLPSRTDTKYFHDYIWSLKTNSPKYGVQVVFFKGRQ